MEESKETKEQTHGQGSDRIAIMALISSVLLMSVVVSVSVFFLASRIETLRGEIRAVHAAAAAGKLDFRLTEKEWGQWYDDYNENYFNGRLPKAVVISDELPAQVGAETTWPNPKKPLIKMNPAAILGIKNAREVLLHEMIHVKLAQRVPDVVLSGHGGGIVWMMGGDDHGAQFQQELHRLIGMGAFDDLLS